MPAVKPVGKGSGLGKKVGPLPLYGWVLIAVAVIGYFVFFRHSGSAAASQKQQTQAQTPDAAMGNVPQAGSPQDTGGATSSMQDAYGASQTESALFSALLSSNQNIADLAAAQIDFLKNNTGTSSTVTNNYYGTGTQPGGSNAPTTTFAAPDIASAATQAAQSATNPRAAADFASAAAIAQNNPQAAAMAYSQAAAIQAGTWGTNTQPREAAAAPYGGVVSTRTTASGVKITTYQSGRVVEQAPGKSAYVAHK